MPLPSPSPFGSVELHFKAMVDTTPFSFDKTYVNGSGETYKVKLLSYYVTNIVLQKKDGSKTVIPNSYHLIELGTRDNIELTSIPVGEYSEVSFLIGVDSAKTAQGVHSGDLDPVKGMFWNDWGIFINFMLEGTSPSSAALGQAFKYHVAGYTSPTSSLQSVHKALPNTLVVSNNTSSRIVYKTDIGKFFDGETSISIAKQPVFENSGSTAKKMSDNYKNMFEVESVQN